MPYLAACSNSASTVVLNGVLAARSRLESTEAWRGGFVDRLLEDEPLGRGRQSFSGELVLTSCIRCWRPTARLSGASWGCLCISEGWKWLSTSFFSRAHHCSGYQGALPVLYHGLCTREEGDQWGPIKQGIHCDEYRL